MSKSTGVDISQFYFQSSHGTSSEYLSAYTGERGIIKEMTSKHLTFFTPVTNVITTRMKQTKLVTTVTSTVNRITVVYNVFNLCVI